MHAYFLALLNIPRPVNESNFLIKSSSLVEGAENPNNNYSILFNSIQQQFRIRIEQTDHRKTVADHTRENNDFEFADRERQLDIQDQILRHTAGRRFPGVQVDDRLQGDERHVSKREVAPAVHRLHSGRVQGVR